MITIAHFSRISAIPQQQLTIEQQRALKAEDSLTTQQQQYDIRMKYALDEKHSALEQVNKLQEEIRLQQSQLAALTEKHQSELNTERQRQDESEQRWMRLIDQSQQETNHLRKQFDQYKNQSEQTEKQLNQKLYDSQAFKHEQTVKIRVNEEKINELQRETALLITERAKLATTVDALRGKLDNTKLKQAKGKREAVKN